MTPLTAREIEIMRLVARGWQDKEIAREMDVSLSRIRQNIHAIAGKLGATNRVQSAVIAFAAGLVSLPETYAAMQSEMKVTA